MTGRWAAAPRPRQRGPGPLAVAGPDDDGSVHAAVRLAGLPANPARIATEVLARWHGQEISVELLARVTATIGDEPAYKPRTPGLARLLHARAREAVQHRQVRMTVAQGLVGVADSTVLLERVTPKERCLLTDTGISLGRALRARGVRRLTLTSRLLVYDGDEPPGREGEPAADVEAVGVQAVLYRGSEPLAYTQEIFCTRAVRER